MHAIAIHTFEPSGEDIDSQLALSVGDRVQILQQDDTGWWAGRKEGTSKLAWFPGNAVSADNCQSPSLLSKVPPSRKIVATPDGRRVATPQMDRRRLPPKSPMSEDPNAKGTYTPLPLSSSKPASTDGVGGKATEQADPESKTLAAAEARIKELEAENAKLEAENAKLKKVGYCNSEFEEGRQKTYVEHLEKELLHLRKLVSRPERQKALAENWQAMFDSDLVTSKKCSAPKVRDLVAVYDKRSHRESDSPACAAAEMSREKCIS